MYYCFDTGENIEAELEDALVVDGGDGEADVAGVSHAFDDLPVEYRKAHLCHELTLLTKPLLCIINCLQFLV